VKNRIFTPTGRKKKQAGLGQKVKNRIFTPTGRKEKQAELEEKSRKKKNCSKKGSNTIKIRRKTTWIL